MKTPTHLTTEEITSVIKNPILIVDKEGVIGRELILKLGKDVQIVFVARSKAFLPSEYARNVIHIPFLKKFPIIPDGKYSYLFIIDNRLSQIKELLPSFVEKAEKDKIPALFVTGIEDAKEDFLALARDKYSKLKILVCGDIFDRNLSLDQEATINKFLYETFAYGKIEVPGSGLSKTYPVYLEDVVSSIFEVMFGSSLSNQVFLVFPKHSPTALGVARAIQKAKPEVKVDFSASQEESVKTLPASGRYLLEDNYPLDGRIRKVVIEGPSQNLDKDDLANYIKQKVEKSSRSRFQVWPVIFSLIFLFLLPFVTTFAFSFMGVAALFQAQSNLTKGNISAAIKWVRPSYTLFSVASAAFQPLYFQANLIGLAGKTYSIGQNIEAGKDLSKAALSFADVYSKMSDVLSGASKNPARDFASANLELSNGLVLIRKIEGNKDLDKRLVEKIKENDSLLNFAANFQTVLPQIIGVSGRRTYLVLFQNNMELRPAGGFIGSYGLLSLSSGKLLSFNVHDVYDADGQLKGHVEPPFAIRRYLPSQHWYLRDSNFDLSFPKAASASAFFLKIEKDINVDGVVAIDVSFVQQILKSTGPVHIAQYNQDVNADNFLKLAQEHSEKNFFPGSTQKKDFLGAVFKSLQNKLAEKISYLSLVRAVEKGIESKDVLLSSADSSVQGLFTVNNWSSSLYDNRIVDENTVNDFLGINEANLGVNKVNYFIDRQITQNSIINGEGKISSELSITYTNKSDGSWPGGEYKNYLRIVVPIGGTLASIKIDGEEQKITDAITDPLIYEKKGFAPPTGFEVGKTQQDGKQIWGLLLIVPTKSKRTIVIDYTLLSELNVKAPSSSYNLKLLKQPGVDSFPFEFTLSYPQSQTAVSVSPGLNKQNGSVVYKNSVIKDENFVVNFAKN